MCPQRYKNEKIQGNKSTKNEKIQGIKMLFLIKIQGISLISSLPKPTYALFCSTSKQIQKGEIE